MSASDFRSVKLQKLDTIIRSLAERSQALDNMLNSTSDPSHKQLIVLEQQVCESIAQDLAGMMQQVSLGELAKRVPVQAPVAAPAAQAAQGGGGRRGGSQQQQQQGAQPNFEGMNKNKLEREKKKQNPEHRAKERARKQANMERKIAQRKAAAEGLQQ